MLYFIIALLLLISFVILYKALMPVGEPSMELTGVMTQEELKAKLIDLAANMNASPSDSSMSSRLIRTTIAKTYLRLSRKRGRKFLDFESWIYDNYYKLNELMTEQKKLSVSYSKLPGYKDLPRIFHIAELLVNGSGGAVTEQTVKQSIMAFNEVLPLKFNEVALLPHAIRLALLEYVAIFCSRSNVINQKFDKALRDIQSNKIDTSLIGFNSYAYAFVKYADGKLLRRFDEMCISNGLSAYKKADNFLAACVRYTGGVSSAIKSIYSLSPKLSDEFLLELCPLNTYLSNCDVVYRECTIATKYVYLQRIAKKAKRTSELAYASEIVSKAKDEGRDIAHYILRKPMGKLALVAYVMLIVGYTISNCITALMYLPQYRLVASIFFVPISLNLVLMLVTSINVRIFSRRYMPRVKLTGNERAMIVYPVLIFDEKEVDEMVDNLLTVSYANNEEIFSYGLLVDLPASQTSLYSDEDERIVSRAKERISALGPRFNLFIRRRVKVDGEEKYQGWEKKRGAILELNNLILTGEKSAFDVVCGDSYKVDYVVTLDSDTMINCAYELVEIMEHPFNKSKAVVSLNVKSAPSSIRTPFASLMSDSVGLNNYSNFIADANYDIFGSGNYTGKGIYRVKDFNDKVGDIFMENRVLSHDFVEGAIAGCGSSGESALDSYPETFSSYLGRNIRWLRGDYQLLPFLFTRIKDGKGNLIRNPISIIARMHIFNNILLGLIPLSSTLLLVLSLFSSAPFWFTIVAFALNIFIFVGSLRLIFRAPKRIGIELLRQLLMVSCLPVVAFNYAKAILVTLYRLIVKKNLLDWKVFAHSGGKVSFLPNIVAVVVYIAVASFVSFKWTFVFMAALFTFGIFYATLLGKRSGKKQVLSEESEVKLKKIAADTWIFFEKQLKSENNFLPYDNYQVEGGVGYAPRTSPTNIGFMITSLVCAKKMGFIEEGDFDFYADRILSAIEKAEKWKGNLYNWMDIYSLRRLSGYVSSVDSGNLLASLILLRNQSKGDIAFRAAALVEQTDIGAFFDYERGLLHIGYDDDSKRYDSNHYDMLGSESMLTYLVGIGTGKLKSSCFTNLSGRCVKYKGVSLYSWTGGAFEYMMSSIYFKYYRSGLLYNSAWSVLKANKSYAKRKRLPFWGISESQHSMVDENGNYQYKAFGVPQISLSNERRKAVVSPYSSMLFLPFFPIEVAKNLGDIYARGLKGDDGLYEAYDGEVIKSYMAHHQGMILASICNYFYDDALIKAFASPDMRAASLLITMSDNPPAKRKREYESLPPSNKCINQVKELSPPAINLMTGGKYSVLIDGSGNGYSYYDGKFVSRYYNHSGGFKLFVNADGQRIDLQKQTAYFFDGKAEFVYNSPKFSVKQTVCALSNMDGEARRVVVKNLTAQPINIDVESYMEVALAPLYNDLAHKTFSGMFVATAHDEEMNAVTATRGGLTLAHYFDVKAEYQSNRGNFFGRSRGESFGRVLDPIVSGKASLSLSPYQSQVLHVYNLVSSDHDKLKKQVKITRQEGFFSKLDASCELIANGNGIGSVMRKVASKLIYDSAPNLVDGDLPLVYIESNAVTERIKCKLKMLSKLGLWGVRIKLVFVYYGDSFVKERILEQLSGIVGSNCLFTLLNKQTDEGQVALAYKSATNIDEITQVEIAEIIHEQSPPYPHATLPKLDYAFKLGKGGFLADASYAMEVGSGLPPRPWSNIISNSKFGTIITESGGGYTYYENSRENKLTEWSNDPVLDECSEGVVIFEDGKSWSCAALPVRADADYQVVHGFGYTEFRCNYNGFYSRMREFISGNVKYYEVTLTSALDFDRTIEVMFFVAPVLGDFPFKTRHNLVSEMGEGLHVKNLFNGKGFTMGCDQQIVDYVCHKQSYTDKNGRVFSPKGKEQDFGYDFQPAIKVRLNVKAKGSARAIFYLSASDKPCFDSERLINEAKSYYSSLSHLTLTTGNLALDYLSKWLPYQIMTSRFFGRTGFYQAGGAIGFRDQLQDCLGVLHVNPSLVKEHILRCAAHQFEAGDVQHWWHEPRTGVRTRISDDRLFLPYITAEYIEFTGDSNILFERIPYLEDVKIVGKDYYGTPNQTVATGTLSEHCIKAIKASARLGENGLVLMGGGDWNDAMDEVGVKGKGTTVWGSMFLYLVINKFLPYIKNKKPYYDLRERLKKAIDSTWDGEWFTRAYCDDGTVLGSKNSKECNIDLITQSFAVISHSVSEQRGRLALLSAASKLVDHENGIIKLLTPPLSEIKAGYICDYPPGVRENGGQYTHGAVWYIMSLFEAGENEYAYSLLNMINPINHSRTLSAVEVYEVEPYVISADVYSQPIGKGGWSWYTGAAAWYYHVMVKYLFGITFNGNNLTMNPRLPKSMSSAAVKIKKDGWEIEIAIDNSGSGEWRFCIGGRGYNTNTIALTPSLAQKEIVLRRIP